MTLECRSVADDEWAVFARLGQAFRSDPALRAGLPGRPEVPPDHWVETSP